MYIFFFHNYFFFTRYFFSVETTDRSKENMDDVTRGKDIHPLGKFAQIYVVGGVGGIKKPNPLIVYFLINPSCLACYCLFSTIYEKICTNRKAYPRPNENMKNIVSGK